MKVLFVRTPMRSFWGTAPGYPLSIGLLAAYLRDKVEDIEVDFLDFEFMDLYRPSSEGGSRLSLVKNYLVSEYPRVMACQKYWESVHTDGSPIWAKMCRDILEQSPDIVAIQCYTVNMTSVKILCDLIRENNDDIKIVLGGPHITLRAEETITALGSVDYCIEGEALEALHQIVLIEKNKSYKNLMDLPGVWFKKNGQRHSGQGQACRIDIDALPFADRFLGNVAGYAPGQHIFTSLGCAWKCAYCSAHRINRGKVFFRSMENVIAELRQLQSQGFKNIRITDDTFTYSKKRVRKFVELVNSSGLSDLEFSFGARVDTIDPELLEIISDLNISYVSLGVEAGTNRILETVMNKKIKIADTISAFDLLNQYKFRTMAFFMLGNPGETIEEMRATYDVVPRIKPSQGAVSIASPLPETDYEAYARKKGMVFTIDDYYKLTNFNPFNHNLSEVKDDDLDRIYRKFKDRILKIQNKYRIKSWSRLILSNPGLILSFLERKIKFFKMFRK